MAGNSVVTTIRAAVEALRTSREALPEHVRQDWAVLGHDHTAVGVWVESGFGSYYPVADCDTDDQDVGPAAAKHIALVASPHVVQALEQLLEAIEAAWQRDVGGPPVSVMAAADSLAAALTRRTA